MALTMKDRMRIAHELRDSLQRQLRSRQRHARSQLELLTERLKSLERARSWLQICHDKGWTATASRILKDIPTTIAAVPHDVIRVQEAVRHAHVEMPLVSDVCRDLDQAEDEFGEVTYDCKEARVSVVTDSIELEEIELGDFEIQLDLAALGSVLAQQPFHIEALDPHPAQGHEGVTHPHVSDGYLCAGDATAPINAALASGRICDFFMLVRSVLTTYNHNSPYVSLDNWQGEPCYDCGYIMPSDDTFWCELCQNVYCPDCVDRCAHCNEGACCGCLGQCPVCEETVCSSCMTTCDECDMTLCERCHHDGACDCVDEDDEEQEEEEISDEAEQDIETEAFGSDHATVSGYPEGVGAAEIRATPGASATVLALRVGEAAVLSGQRPD